VVPSALTEPVALLLLAATLAFAVVRPRGLPEAVVAIPAAILTLVLGILPAQVALEELRSLAPTIGSWPRCWCWPSCATARACSKRPGGAWPPAPAAGRWPCSGWCS
jgi:hypothetical protein